MSVPRYTFISGITRHVRQIASYFRERGLKNGMSVFMQTKSLKHGDLKGVDRFGNQYYESAVEVPGRHRWVVYPSRKHVNASNIPPEWHGWLHHMNDWTPVTPMVLSEQGAHANYLPPGHLLRPAAAPATFAKTGAGTEDKLDGAYESWSNEGSPNPADQWAYVPKTERR